MSNNTLWTPGPWFRRDAPHTAGYRVAALERKQHGGGETIVTVRPAHRTPEAHAEAKANAHLISVAPEMAAVLREFIRLGDTNEMNPGALQDLYGAACCVMAKAQGEAS